MRTFPRFRPGTIARASAPSHGPRHHRTGLGTIARASAPSHGPRYRLTGLGTDARASVPTHGPWYRLTGLGTDARAYGIYARASVPTHGPRYRRTGLGRPRRRAHTRQRTSPALAQCAQHLRPTPTPNTYAQHHAILPRSGQPSPIGRFRRRMSPLTGDRTAKTV